MVRLSWCPNGSFASSTHKCNFKRRKREVGTKKQSWRNDWFHLPVLLLNWQNKNTYITISLIRKQEYKKRISAEFFRVLGLFSTKITLFGRQKRHHWEKDGVFSEENEVFLLERLRFSTANSSSFYPTNLDMFANNWNIIDCSTPNIRKKFVSNPSDGLHRYSWS